MDRTEIEKLIEENEALHAEIDRVWKKNLQEVTMEREYFKLCYDIAVRTVTEMFKNITVEQIKNQIEKEIAIQLGEQNVY